MHRARQVSIILLTLVGLASPARGTTPGQWSIGLAPSYAFIVLADNAEPKGGGAELFVTYGISDAFALRVRGSWTGHQVEADEQSQGGLYHVVSAAVGLQYAFDTLSVTPSIEGGAGLLYLQYAGDSAVNLGLYFGVGVDYWVLPWLAPGAAFHYHAFISDPTTYPVYFDAGPRVTVRWP